MSSTLMLDLPEPLYERLRETAKATRRSLEEVVLHAVKVGSPPSWDDVPSEFQADLAALDRLEDEALWNWIYARYSSEQSARATDLLERECELSPEEQLELARLQAECDRFMLCKAQAGVLLRWRGHQVP